MLHFDKDRRFMAAFDLAAQVSEGMRFELGEMKELCNALVCQMDDPSIEVQWNAVHCLTRVFPLFGTPQRVFVLNRLTILLVTGNEELRDVYGSCIRSILPEITPDEASSVFSKAFLSNLFPLLTSTKHEVVDQLDTCLDVMNAFLTRIGDTVCNVSDELVCTLFRLLENPNLRVVTRKRLTASVGHLSVTFDDGRFGEIVRRLSHEMTEPGLFSSAVIAMIRSCAGCRLRPHLPIIVKCLISGICEYCDVSESRRNDESVEVTLNCLESILSLDDGLWRYGQSLIDSIISALKALMGFNPNFIGGETDIELSEYDEGGYSDDEDTSWKIRKSAVKVVGRMLSLPPSNVTKWSHLSTNTIILRELFLKEFEETIISRADCESEETVVTELVSALRHCTPNPRVSNALAKIAGNTRFKRIKIDLTVALKAPSKDFPMDLEPSQIDLDATRVALMGPYPEASALEAVRLKQNELSSLSDSLSERFALPTRILVILDSVSELIRVEPILVKEVDLGPFRHRVDEGSTLRKTAIILSGNIVNRLAQTNPGRLEDDKDMILESCMRCCSRALAIEPNQNGSDLYGHVASILNRVSKMDLAFTYRKLVAILPQVEKLLTAPVVKAQAESLSVAGVQLGHLMVAIEGVIEAQAMYEGYRSVTIIKRDYPAFAELKSKILSDPTPGLLSEGIKAVFSR